MAGLWVSPAWSQDQLASEPEAAPPEAPPADKDKPLIVVIGQRAIIAVLQDVEPEQTYDSDYVASYGASTIGEVLEELRVENGDEAPSLLVNGQPVKSLGDISDFPVEAVQRIEQLPRGAAQRIGGGASQRAYNIVLKPSVKSATATVSQLEATEGGWGQDKQEGLLTYIRERDRLNLTLRHSDSGFLLESERHLTPRAEAFPFSALGNVIPFRSTQVDPLASARFGQPVTVIALSGLLQPSLADLLAGANLTNPSDAPRFRSLRGVQRPWEAALAGNIELTPWLSLSVNGRLAWSEGVSLRGLPSARFLVPVTNTFTPFSTAVQIALSDAQRPLRSISDTQSQSLTATWNANLGDWHASLLTRFDERESTFSNDTNGSIPGGFIALPDDANPFDTSIGSLVPVNTRVSTSHNIERQISADAEGPLVKLPAGPILARAGAGLRRTSFDAADPSNGRRAFRRRELAVTAGITVPITGEGWLAQLGNSEVALDVGRLDQGRFGTIDRFSASLNWSPVDWLLVNVSETKDGTAIFPELIGAPVVITENVPYFDPLRGETVDVRLVTGGAPNLSNPSQRTRAISATITPLRKYNLQLDVDYQHIAERNLIGALPFPSSAIVAAFPDRFVRNAAGTLVQVDTTSVNFDREDTHQIHLGVGMSVPLETSRRIPATGTAPARRTRPARLQVNVSHTLLLDSTTVIREGLPVIDLLAGGAIGIGGGQQRNVTTATLAVTKAGSGVRLNANYRGPSYLQTGTQAAPDRLKFGSLLQVDLRLFAELDQMLPTAPFAKGTRISVTIDNLFNQRQKVTDRSGATPQAYQPAFRDPIGRSVTLELRHVF
jgi:hypothetical protein